MTSTGKDDSSILDLRDAAKELTQAVSFLRDQRNVWQMPGQSLALPVEANTWNFTTFEKYINQRLSDLSLQLRERYEAQQTGLAAALAAAEKAVHAALVAAEKAVDKAESAQQLRNEAQNEFRKSLADLSGLMWTIKEGTAAVDSLRRETNTSIDNIDKKILALGVFRSEATETVRQAFDSRVSPLEVGFANIQGRIWAVSALFAIAAMGVSIVTRFIGH